MGAQTVYGVRRRTCMFPPKPGMRAGDSGAVASLLNITSALFPSPYAARPPPAPATSVATVPPPTRSRTGVAALWTSRAPVACRSTALSPCSLISARNHQQLYELRKPAQDYRSKARALRERTGEAGGL
jgi:hypothetical protein